MGKSTNHKNENTFRFQTFSERITNINIDVIHQIRHYDDTPEETGTYFGEALQKQSELNCTDHYVDFKKEIVRQVQSFAQLVHNEDNIVAALKKHLAVPDSMALPALLDLLVQLARDLQKDFYRYFQDFFHILVKLLNTYTQNVEVLEAAFTCLSYLFKFLWRYLLRDIQEVYSLFSSLISKQYKEYVRNFAAESFAFLMRKCKDHSGLFDFMLSGLVEEPDKAEGVGRLLFEMMKGIKEQFHSCTSHVFPILLDKLGPKEKQSSDSLPWQQVEVAVTSAVLSMAQHSNKEHMTNIWDMLLEATESAYKECVSARKQAEKMLTSSTLERLLRILNSVIEFNQGKVITKPDTIAKVLTEFVRGPSLPDSTGLVLLEVTGSVLITSHSKIQVENSSRLLPAVFKTSYPVQTLYDFTKRLFDLPLFEKDILPSLLKYSDPCMKKSDNDVKELTLLLLTELILNKSPSLNDGRDIDALETYMLDYGSSSGDKSVPSFVLSCLDTKLSTEDICTESLAKVWSAIVCLPHVRPLKNKDKVMKTLAALMRQIFEMENLSNPTVSNSLSAIACQCLVTMVMMLKEQEVFQYVPLEVIVSAMCAGKDNIHVLRLADVYFTHAVNEDFQDVLSVDTLLKIFSSLQDNLSSPQHLVRLLTLRILSSFDLPLSQSDIEVANVFTICLNAELTGASIHEYREKLRYLQKLEYTAVQNTIPAGPFGQVPLRYLMGSLYINFKLLWEPTRTLISSHAHSMERDVFWGIYSSHLQTASENAEKQLAGCVSAPSIQLEEFTDKGLAAAFSKNVVALSGKSDLQPDYSNFRVQLWKAMHEFPEKCSPKSRILVPLLFRFLQNEYYVADLNVAPSQNVCRGQGDDVAMETDDEEMDMSPESPAKKEKAQTQTGYYTRLRERKESLTAEEIDDRESENEDQDSDDELSESSDDDSDEPIGVRTRNHDKAAESSEHDEHLKTKSKKKKKRGLETSLAEDPMDMHVENNRGKKRLRTRSMGEDYVDGTKRRMGGKNTPTRRIRTRSVNPSSEDEDDSDLNVDVSSDENEEDDIDEYGDADEQKSKYAKNQGLSAIKGKDVKLSDTAGKEISGSRSVTNKPGKLGNQKQVVRGSKKKNKAATGSLLVKLELFAKFKDPMCMYMEPQLKQLYLDLLIHKNADVQKTAFQCIMTYKYSYLLPYRENFNRLLEDKSFKNEIILFSIDHENGAISKEHRQDVLPVLMRILYGKMHVKTGKGTAGKQYSNVRQSIVFRFLNGCQSDELKIFVDLVFAPFRHLVTDNPLTMVRNIIENTDLTNVLPVKRMQGALNSVGVIFKKLGHRLDSFLPDIIQIVFGLGSLCGVLLSNRLQLVPHVINPLKSARQNVVYRIIQILETYDKYPWQPVEIDAMFEALVWPQLDKLSNEGLYHPTPLLKLFSCCVKNPRYFMLLCKHHHDNQKLSPLSSVMKLLLHPGVSSQVTKCIMEMICKLLQEMDEDQEIKYLEVTNTLALTSAENVRDIDVGIRLLLPHIPDILVYIQTFVTKLNMQINKRRNLSVKELEILSRISSFVRDEEMSSTLVNLLLPFLNPKLSKPLKVEEDILRSVINLLKQINDRLCFFQPVGKLFASLSQRPSRILLAEAFSVVCEKDEALLPLATIIQQLNSWDRTRMDEPNYMLRLEGYRSATTLLKDMDTMETRTCLTLIYNCCFFISSVEDMSLRDCSTMCMITMVNQFGSLPFDDHAYNKVILGSLLPEVKSGMKTKKQTVFHEFVTILSTLVDTYGNQSSFTDLKPLRDKDIEADFFENIKHIQVFKRSRALRRLMKYLSTTKVSFSTVSNIFLPMVSTFLVDDSYKKHTTVLEAAIECIGTICRLLPWKSYLNQLKHYLSLLPKKLERQKLLVRVIVSILDNFHFDLSQSTLNVKKAPVPKVEREPPEENVEKQTEKILEDEKKVMEVDDKEAEPAEVVPEINEEGVTETVIIGKEKQVCAEPLATKIHGTILKNVIHHLHRILVQKGNIDKEHKVNKSKYAEDDEILRVPIALAMIKLLQNLPKGALERYLPGILLKVCNFLRSRSIEIRNTSRDTLVKIQNTLGPRFFPFILSELKGTLRRGYQRHVLCYTVHQLLKNMESVVKPGDIDVCLTMLQQVLNEEIFGEVSDEKDVAGIKAKVFEARSSKSYESYEFIARYINPRTLVRLMGPINTILDTTRSHKSSRKVQEVLKKVTSGLLENKNMTVETLLVFVHSLTTQTLPLLSETKSAEIQPMKPEELPGQKPASCLLIPKEAPRGGLKPKPNKKTNKHILVEFGLQLLGMCLKKQKVVSSDSSHIQMLDPLVPMLGDCLYSKYVIVNANSLRVLCKLLKFPLPSMKDNIKRISSGMFILLRNYATAGAVRGENLELVTMLFKAVTVLVRDVKVYKMESSEVQVLLTFCEEDIHDHTRQSTAFSLLKSILSRKLDKPEIHELMLKVQEMSISEESPHVQRECRQALMQYLLDYPLGKKLVDHLKFYISQLSFELDSGRESALEMMASFFTSFPQSVLAKHAGLFFVPMAASLANDESAKCRKLIALALKTLLGNLDHNSRTGLYNIAKKWFMDDKMKLRSLAAQLCGLFVEVECTQFESRLSDILPVIEQQLEPGKYKQVDSSSIEHDQDLMIYHTLNTLLKILRECNTAISSPQWESNMTIIWEHVQTYLSYPHIWVQLSSCQLFGMLFAACQPEQLVTMETTRTGYFSCDAVFKLRQLALDFLTQLQSELLNDDLASQVIKNMIYVTKCAKYIVEDEGKAVKHDEDNDDEDKVRRLTVLWLVRKMVREAHHEAINNNKMVIKRMHVFKWLAAVSLDLGECMDNPVLTAMLPPIQRELNDQSMYQDENLRNLAQEVVELLKKAVGIEKFSGAYAGTQKVRAERRDERKRQRAVQAVANPELAAQRKLRKNLGKIDAKKRKADQYNILSKKAKKKKYQEMTLKD